MKIWHVWVLVVGVFLFSYFVVYPILVQQVIYKGRPYLNDPISIFLISVLITLVILLILIFIAFGILAIINIYCTENRLKKLKRYLNREILSD